MNPESFIVRLLPKDREAITHTEERWIREQRGGVLCWGCMKRRPELFPAPVDIPIRELERGTSYSSVCYGGVGVIHVRFLEVLRRLEPHMPEHVLGKCLWWKDGSVLEDYRSIYLRRTIMDRGGKDTEYHVCKVCGGITSTVWNSPYVLRSDLGDSGVYQDRVDCLYLHQEVARRLPWREFVDLEPFRIPILDEPLPDDPFPGLGMPQGK